MTAKQPADMSTLAAEALDLWQEHLTALASSADQRANLAELMEPSRRMFAEWMEKAQNPAHAATAFTATNAQNGPAPAGTASDDGALRLAQLALHVAELEKRVAKLEQSANRKLPPKLQELLAKNNPDFEQALVAESISRARTFIQGVKTYRHHAIKRDAPEMPVIWESGTTRLIDYNPLHPNAPIALVIPSLINRFDILDLDFVPSFLRSLAASGFRPLVVDWDAPGKTEKNFTLTDYTKRLEDILGFVAAKISPAPLHLLGYCMGGLLALALATLHPGKFKILALLATPWDFHAPDPEIGITLAELTARHEQAWQAAGHMPVDILQMIFALLQPFQSAPKFADFAKMHPDTMEARQFVLLEDWLNDGVPLTVPVAHECLQNWYGKNATATYHWRINDTVIDPRQIQIPSYVIVPGRDRIVPPESALPLAKLLPHATLHEPMTGHIGMIASRNASQQIWKPLFHWLKNRG